MKKTIYIIVGQFKGDYVDKYTSGIMRQANDLDYDTVCFSMSRISRTKSNREKDIYKIIDFDRCDGVVLNADSFYELKNLSAMIEQSIIKSGKPYTVIGTSAFTENYFHYPYYDDMCAMMEHLIVEHNCKKIYCLGDLPDRSSSRLDAFRDTLKKHNLPCPHSHLLYGGFWIDCAERVANDIAFNTIDMPDAIMCITDQIAMALVKALFRKGIRVPDDIIVAGLDGHPESFNYEMPLTTVPIDGEHLGRTAMNRLHEMLGNEVEVVPIKKTRVITGMSCGCGVKKSSHTRSRLMQAEEAELHRMYYRNCEIQEKLYHLQSYTELPIILDNLTYLVPNMSTFSLSLVHDNYHGECLFHSNWTQGDNTVSFDYRDIIPPQSSMDNQVRNMHVVPIAFMDKFFGYATAGYHQPQVYGEMLQKFTRDISIALDFYEHSTERIDDIIIREHKPERVTTKVYSDIQHIDEEVSTVSIPQNNISDNVLYAIKDGALTKVNLDNILYFESYDKRVNVVVKSGEYEVRNTLMELEEMMATRNYMRVSKSILLNLDKVGAVRPEPDRTIVAVLTNKETVRVSRKYAKEFRDKMKF